MRADVLGFTNDDPNETTLFALLKATFATAFATGTPFWRTNGYDKLFEAILLSWTHDLLVYERMLRHIASKTLPETNGGGVDI